MAQEVTTPAVAIGPAASPKPAGLRPSAEPQPRASVISAKLNLAGEDRRQLIAEAAYFRAERRGFHPGKELEDWLAAEIEVDALLEMDDISV